MLRTNPESWKAIYNSAVQNEERRLTDDPVPKAVSRTLHRVDLRLLSEAQHAVLPRHPGVQRGNG